MTHYFVDKERPSPVELRAELRAKLELYWSPPGSAMEAEWVSPAPPPPPARARARTLARLFSAASARSSASSSAAWRARTLLRLAFACSSCQTPPRPS